MANDLVSYNNELMDLTQLGDRLIDAHSEKEINDIISVFNLNIKKKDVIRASKFSELQDKITDQIGKRIEKRADEFSNKDLLDYMNALQNILNKQNEVQQIEVPQIAVQNNINVSVLDTLSKESRDKVRNAVQAILERQNSVSPVDFPQNEQEIVDIQ